MQNDNYCLICGNKYSYSKLLKYTDDESKSREYLVFKCCNYLRIKKRFESKENKKLYAQDYHAFNYEGLNYYKRILFLYTKGFGFRRYIVNKDVLEIGAATGEFLNECKRYNPKSLTGVELSKHASNEAKKRYGFNFVNKDISRYKPSKKFDTIFLFHVIEHLPNPYLAIKNYHKLLKNGGTLIMETPNIDSWEFKLFGDKWLNLSIPFHTYVFSTNSLKKLGKMNSFKRVDVDFVAVTNIFPVQFYKVNRNLTNVFYIPLFFLYQIFFYISVLFQKGGLVTIFLKKQP